MIAAPSADSILAPIFAQLRVIVDAGDLTGSTTIHWRDGRPTSFKVEAHTGANEGWRLPRIGGSE